MKKEPTVDQLYAAHLKQEKKLEAEDARRFKKRQIDFNRYIKKVEREKYGPPKKKNKPTRKLKRI